MTTPLYEPPSEPAETGGPAPLAFRHLAPEHVIAEQIVARIVAGVLTLLAVAGFAVSFLVEALPAALWLALLAPVAALLAGAWWMARAWPPIEHAHAGWALDPAALHIQKGVYWRSVTSIPRARIQHTDVSQGPLQRSYELATLVVYTAGTSHSQIELAGLRHADALRLRDDLLEAGAWE